MQRLSLLWTMPYLMKGSLLAHLTISVVPQDVCFQGKSGLFFTQHQMSANDPKCT